MSSKIRQGKRAVWAGEKEYLLGATQVPVVLSAAFGYRDMAYWLDVATGKAVVRSGKNELKVEITNLRANRLVGDAKLPREKRVTRITQQVPIQGPHESGLFGPVQLLLTK